ncbi:MAG TPA: metallophosphoesterase [Burkholderiaceae bacterium]|nr:metallophosphoesterase [Burkholderiaceae bacterium]
MTTLLQISDAHFGTEQPPVVQALLQLAHADVPDLVVMSGDITQRARRHQFAAARAFIEQLKPAALLTIPGNHDIPLFNLALRAFAPYANYSRAFGENLEPVFESPHLLVIGVNTTRPQRHKDGELSAQQIERVTQQLQRAAASQLRIIVVHQPVLAIRKSDEDNLLDGYRQAVPAWAAAGGDIIMGGHIHLPYVRSMRTTFGALPRDLWTVQAGTAVSSRLREGITNSVNVIRCNGDQSPRRCVVERWDYVPTLSRFEQHSNQELTFAATVG